MFPLKLQELPPICIDTATDMLGDPDASQIETAVAVAEVEAATVSQIGSIAFIHCRVPDCPVRCKVFHSRGTDGTFRATGVASDAGTTDLSNCVK